MSDSPPESADQLRFREEVRSRSDASRTSCCSATLASCAASSSSRSGGLSSRSRLPRTKRPRSPVLNDQVAAWNRGDLDGFMDGYWRDEKLTFTSGDKVTKGWEADTRAVSEASTRLRTGRTTGGTPRTRFEELDVESFSPTAALVRGRYVLKLSERDRDRSVHTGISQVRPMAGRSRPTTRRPRKSQPGRNSLNRRPRSGHFLSDEVAPWRVAFGESWNTCSAGGCEAAVSEVVTDSELLRRFTATRDEAAFELLVWRYGAMVLGLCRRAVRDEQLRRGRVPGGLPRPRAEGRLDPRRQCRRLAVSRGSPGRGSGRETTSSNLQPVPDVSAVDRNRRPGDQRELDRDSRRGSGTAPGSAPPRRDPVLPRRPHDRGRGPRTRLPARDRSLAAGRGAEAVGRAIDAPRSDRSRLLASVVGQPRLAATGLANDLLARRTHSVCRPQPGRPSLPKAWCVPWQRQNSR